MKKIKPISIWLNGVNVDAVSILLHINYDNLIDTCTFYYALYNVDDSKLTDGNITMTGDDYKNWQDDITLYDWISKTLSITSL